MSPKKEMTLLLIVLLILVGVGVGAGWHLVFGRPNPPLPQQQLTIQNMPSTSATTTTGSMDASSTAPQTDQLSIDGATFNVEIASTMIAQARGLSYRTSLGANDGMLFLFSTGSVQTFWMKDMNFPLDMIWISGTTVVGFAQNAPAEPGVAIPSQIFSSPGNTDKVLEVNAGTVAKYNIKVGDTVVIGPMQ
jgi:uncharacterized membrane protein (UPF0127 family)